MLIATTWYEEVKQETKHLKKIISSNNICLHNEKFQTHLDPASGTFSAIDLTFSDPSIFIDYNWRVYKDPCGSDHYPIIIENSTIKKSRNHKQIPHNGILKKQTGNPTKNCLTTQIPETNTNQDEPIIHFTNTLITIANKTIAKTTINHGSQGREKK